jgi:ABC-2 type transport system permease protein
MLANVFTRTTRERMVGPLVAAVGLALWLATAMSAYQGIDLGIYTNLPSAIRSLMGIPEQADVGALAFGVVFSFVAAMTVASLALSMGAGAIAGEEREGTLGLLLANPVSRRRVVVSKAASMALLIGVASLVLYAAGLSVPRMLGVETGGIHVGATVLHMWINALFYGFLALLIGAWTGERSKASGITAGVMVLSYFAVGLLPLIPSAADLARIFPWYYYDGSDPLLNGVSWGHAALLGGLAVSFLIGATLRFDRRDLREGVAQRSILDRLRANRVTRRVAERLAGSTRVSRIWVKALSEHQGLLVLDAYVMFLVMGLLMGPMYRAIDDMLVTFAANVPKALMAMVGDADLATPEGWFQTETFALMGPIAVMAVTVAMGARALAGEEERRTLGLLLGNPIARRRIVLEKAAAMALAGSVVGLFTWLGVGAGSAISGLGMSFIRVGATSLLMTLLGLLFGALALAIGAATGRVRVAVYGTIGTALGLYLVDSLAPLSDAFAGYARWSPFHYFLGSSPLTSALEWSDVAVLAGLSALVLAVAVVVFDRRDLRVRG